MIALMDKLLKILFFIVPIFPWIKEFLPTFGNVIEIILLLGIYTLSFFVIVKGRNKEILKKFLSLNVIITILLIYTLIYDGNLSDGLSGFRIYLEIFITIMGINIIYVYKGKEGVLNITKYILYITIILSLFGLIQFIYPDIVVNMHSSEIYTNLRMKSDFKAFSIFNRAISLMNDPNVYAMYLIVVYPIVDILYSNDILSRKLKIILKILISINILLTNSRQGLILYVFYIILMLILKVLEAYKKQYIKVSLKVFFNMFLIFIISMFIILNISYILENILRIDTISNLNGRSEKNEFVRKMLFDSGVVKLLFGNGISSSRDFIFENSYFLLIYQLGIFTSILIFYITRLMLKIPGSIDCFKVKISKIQIPIIIFLLAMYTGDWIIIPQIMIPLVAVLFSVKL
ncbi:hypothetical protein [Paraclostridium bifermentans]|uniref:hypothetical protein n=1 Tax=Paraclostridium bifermentans TaxID=1490 RepID=UPI0024B98539|nr:hypothetical protein [Paraclostridium bifermentans]